MNFSNITDFQSMLQSVNTGDQFLFWNVTIYMLLMVLFMMFIQRGFVVAWIGSSFLAWLISIPLLYMELISQGTMWSVLGMLIFGIIYSIIWNKESVYA